MERNNIKAQLIHPRVITEYRMVDDEGDPTFMAGLREFLQNPTPVLLRDWNDRTREVYERYYCKFILPCLPADLGVSKFTAQDFEVFQSGLEKLCESERQQEKMQYLFKVAYLGIADIYGFRDNIFGTSMLDEALFQQKLDETTATKLKKSLDKDEVNSLLRRLDGGVQGEELGILIMLLTGCRNGEVCGLDYGDLSKDEKGYSLIISKSVSHDGRFQASGKTWNSPRRLPIHPYLGVVLETRMLKIQHMIDIGRFIPKTPVERMPVVCRNTTNGEQYDRRCVSNVLTEVGRNIFRELAIRTDHLEAELNSEAVADLNEGPEEKEPTTYCLRRNWCTWLYANGMSEDRIEYYMGHTINGPKKRSFYNNQDEQDLMRLVIDKVLDGYMIDIEGGK